MIKKIILASLLAAAFGSIATTASAEVIIRVAPPALRTEVVPEPRHGQVWSAGHWEWRHNNHQWVGGTWMRERRGYHYTQPTWAEHDGRWQMTRGAWARGDRDGDGVPNGADRAPNNPNRN